MKAWDSGKTDMKIELFDGGTVMRFGTAQGREICDLMQDHAKTMAKAISSERKAAISPRASGTGLLATSSLGDIAEDGGENFKSTLPDIPKATKPAKGTKAMRRASVSFGTSGQQEKFAPTKSQSEDVDPGKPADGSVPMLQTFPVRCDRFGAIFLRACRWVLMLGWFCCQGAMCKSRSTRSASRSTRRPTRTRHSHPPQCIAFCSRSL